MGRFRISLSPPAVGASEVDLVRAALESGWVAPLGPHIGAFESELAKTVGRRFAVAVSSGTAALHLAYKRAGIEQDSVVVMPTLTFGATAFPVRYLGATCVFIDVDPNTWTIDVELLRDWLDQRAAAGQLPAALVTVDLFGVPCDYASLKGLAAEHRIPLIADAAESLGSQHDDGPAGSFGDSAILSFNGNKIITTSAGGMYLTNDGDAAAKVRYWAAQSRGPVPWYQHEEIGYNYRMSNLLAALGRAQLRRLPEFVSRRREIRGSYTELLSALPGVRVIGDPPWGTSNAWLTTIRIDGSVHPNGPTRVREALERENIESRPVWKPMHQQPVFAGAETVLTGVADEIFAEGLCLPSGSAMTDDDVQRVADAIIRELG